MTGSQKDMSMRRKMLLVRRLPSIALGRLPTAWIQKDFDGLVHVDLYRALDYIGKASRLV